MLEHIHLQKMINTMNRPQNRNHKWLHIKFACIAILLTLGASTVQADDFMQKESNYSAMVIDKDRIQFTLPTQYWSSFLNEGISEGHVYVTIDGGSRRNLFDWKAATYNNINSRNESGNLLIQAFQAGTFQLAGKTKGGTKSFTNNSGQVSYNVANSDRGRDYFETTVIWTVPYELRGHTLKFEMWAHIEDRDYNYYVPTDNKDKSSFKTLLDKWDCPAAPEVSVLINDPMIAVESEHVNELMLTYSITARSVKSADLHYTDQLTGKTYSKSLEKTLVGKAYLPADRPWKDVYIDASVVDAEGNTPTQKISSEKKTTKIIHHPKNLQVSINAKGEAVLTWGVENADWEDLADADNFEIQRIVTGSTARIDPNWTTISGDVIYEQGKARYTTTDNTLLNSYTGQRVAYRIRRIYSSMWKWADNSGYAFCEVPTQLMLPTLNNAQVTRSDTWNDDQHLAQFSFNLEDNIVPEGFFVIRNAQDWHTFAVMINDAKNTKDINAILEADITTSEHVGVTEGAYYRGTFEGNGHTITFNKSDWKELHMAPFRYVGNATIRNLHTTGAISTSQKFVGGLIARVVEGSTVNIENCRSSMTLTSSIYGDATNGGFVALGSNGSSVTFSNCKFDGILEGANCYNNGGFVGWSYGSVTIDNSIFAPDHIGTKVTGCNTWARMENETKLSVINSYAIHDYATKFLTIRSESDWTKFREMIDATDGKEPIHAVLDADIKIKHTAALNTTFTGTFDGNGHTIDVNISGIGLSEIALFGHVTGNTTIKNLHLTGTVKGDMHTAGLVGYCSGSDVTLNVERVWVSTEVTATKTHAGGIIGHSNLAHVYMKDCRFDGLIITNNAPNSYAGEIIGWCNGGSWHLTRVYDCGDPPRAYWRFYCINYNSGTDQWNKWGTNGSSFTVTQHAWSDVNYYNKIDQNEVVNLMNGNQAGTWQLVGGKAVPVMETLPMESLADANSVAGWTVQQLQETLGDEWQIDNGQLTPKIKPSSFAVALWDSRAKLQLRINMQGEKGVEQKIADLSTTDAVTKHAFTQELTRKCVEYSFDLLVIRDSSPLKFNGYDGDTLVVPVQKADKGDLQNYRFLNNDRITSLETITKQSSVQLVWKTSGGDHDFFRVLRRKHTDDEKALFTDTLATNLEQMSYEDKTVLAQQAYDYRVESVWQCEGSHVESMTRTGQCKVTGLVEGYVRMADGTAMAGVAMECKPISGASGANSIYKTKTDDHGYYAFRELPYQTNGKYEVTAISSGDAGSFTGPNANGEVNFTTSSNWKQDFNFFLDTYYIYSGNVYYRDTSIPVPGVSFKLDGQLMHDASQHLITTNTQGAFELSIPRGAHSVQAVKEGHHFANNGYLINKDAVKDSTQYNFVKNVAGVFLWDSTTVVLHGRVVGGDIQGTKPLGRSLSQNNLGDSLKIVMQLEGDNTSWLIRKQNDETVKSADYKVAFGLNEGDTTQVNVTRHTLTIRPDQNTGEYEVALHPAKYKVIEVSAQGYATLFQQGKVGETLDLTFNVDGDTCVYNRIYHAVPDVDVKQFNPRDEQYFGTKQITSTDNIGNHYDIATWYYRKLENGDSIATYAFEYPVFMAGTPYGWILQACEKYYWNNEPNNQVDIVNLNGGCVTIQNAMLSKNEQTTVELDENGGGSYVFTPDNKNFLLTGKSALKNVSITLEYDNSFFDIKPLNGKIMSGYVMASTPKTDGRKGVMAGEPHLFEILRDPPGSGSSAYIEEGSKLSYGYTFDLNASAGVKFALNKGENANIYNGTVIVPQLAVAGTEAGTIMETSKKNVFAIDAITNFGTGWTYSYNFDVTERIQTRTGQKWIGPKADLFIGMTDEVVVEDAIAVRVIPEKLYQLLKTHEGGSFEAKDALGNKATIKVPTGTMKVLAQGTDPDGKPVYLVRDEVMAVGPRLQSTFIHSQHFVETELLPDLINLRNSMLLPVGTSTDYAQQLADKKGYTTYISTVDENDESYGFSYTTIFPKNNKIYAGDSISALNNTVKRWIGFLAKNEMEKLAVTPNDLVKRYSIDGGASSIQYSESFSVSDNESRYLHYPGIDDLSQVTSGTIGVLKTFIDKCKHLFEISGQNANHDPEKKESSQNGVNTIEIKTGGSYFQFTITPALSLSVHDKNTTSKTNSKKFGFTLGLASKSSLTVDAYRTGSVYTVDTTATAYNKISYEMLEKVRTGSLGSNPLTYVGYNEKVYSSFVFRTRGGVTCEPYEDERKTKWYQPGAVLDVATVPVDKPRIWIDEPVKSNVPFDQPARFKLHIANETDYPEQASMTFNYFLLASSNPDGAKVFVDGTPINSQGVNITLYPFRDENNDIMVFTKEIEVYPGTAFDYNDLTLCLFNPEDMNRVFDTKFSAHFVPTAGKVNISSPSNNWVMNTESPYDGKRQGWYMPVRIDGFNTNEPGFDHIELQYKLSTQGDKDWVNVCSYYANDSLRERASGMTDTIPNNGTIIAKFYGEVDPVEQYYDLRAVNYCRHGNGFLTGMSPVLKGIKDTRLPELFGTPEPVNGILSIGDDLKITFSEPIAGNYLSKINNFELLGSPTNNDISTSTSLTFDGKRSIAISQGSRNLSNKSFTVDLMLNPATDKGDMGAFMHGGKENGVMFGLTADRRLMAKVNNQTVVSDSIVNFNNQLHEVAYVLDQSGTNMTVSFFDGSKQIGSKELTGKYENSSYLYLGSDFWNEDMMYKGDMLEFRLWNRAMTSAELDEYGKKQLSGYESGLVDYYRLNEGASNISYDRASGSNDLMLVFTNWKRPAGISMKLDGKKGLRLKPDKFMRSKQHDYTLTFWFRTNSKNATLFSNGEAVATKTVTERDESEKDETRVTTREVKIEGAEDQLNIGTNNGNLYIRSGGLQQNIEAYVSDGEWHHFILTVSRSRNLANVYVDQKQVDAFPADSIGGIAGDHIALGATYVDKNTPTNVMTGNIDEVGMFESVLPVKLLSEFATHTPTGTVSSLMAYLDFGRSKRMDDNTLRLEPTGISIKRYKDNQGNIVERRDTLINDIDPDFVDRNIYAPMVSNSQLNNLNFSYVANGNQLLVNIKEPDYTIEKTNVYLTVKEIPDLQGNLMSSPVTMNVYVYRNPLRWDVSNISKDLAYGEGVTLEATIMNQSAERQSYELKDLPIWITASQTSGVINALGKQTITFTVSPYINIGTYNEQIDLMGENNMSEPLPLTLNVRGEEPDWTVSDERKQNCPTMMMVARVKIDGVVADSPEDIVGVFNENLETLGVAHIEIDNTANVNEALAYLTIYGNDEEHLHFKFFDASTGNIHTLKEADNTLFVFKKDAMVGSASNPVVLVNEFYDMQTIKLKKGWNWVSFNVIPADGTTVGYFLDNSTIWEAGDKITTVDGTDTKQYTCDPDKTAPRGYKWDSEDQPIDIDASVMYQIYSMSDKTVYLEGYSAGFFSVTVHQNWNRLGYTQKLNLPLAQAMNAYADEASEGDVVKSQDAFAVATKTTNGIIWKGDLKYMEAGKGYMLKRLAADSVSFYYPSYYSDSRYQNTRLATPSTVNSATTMNIVASVSGVDVEEGDKLVAYLGGERMDEAVADDEQNYYLSIGTDTQNAETIQFVMERNGEPVVTTKSGIRYEANQLLGTPAEPTVINFVSISTMPQDGNWYTLSGILLPQKPTQAGLYIYNGKVQVIK